MHQNIQRAAAGILFVCAASTAMGNTAGPLADAGQVISTLQAAGYGAVRDIELDDGLWEAEVRGADGRWHDLHVDPASGEVIDPRSGGQLLDAGAITRRVEAAGYTGIHDLELDEAVWDVEARDAAGQRVELRVHGFTGAILVSGPDR